MKDSVIVVEEKSTQVERRIFSEALWAIPSTIGVVLPATADAMTNLITTAPELMLYILVWLATKTGKIL